MKKASMLGAIILSCIFPGAGLLLLRKYFWFVLYAAATTVGILLLFFWGLGMFILFPISIIGLIHTIVAVNKNNAIVNAT